jgi:hypothetical protein
MQRAFFMLLFCLPAIAHGQQTCSWLNAATAGGLLGGPVTLSVVQAEPKADLHSANATSSYGPTSANASSTTYNMNVVDDADCTFTRSPAPAGEMHIKVVTVADAQTAFHTYAAQCGGRGIPLKAIGNEAITCDLKGKHGHPSELVIGRIRDRVFQLTIVDRSTTPAALREKARAASEIVAGNLF